MDAWPGALGAGGDVDSFNQITHCTFLRSTCWVFSRSKENEETESKYNLEKLQTNIFR